MKDGNGKYYPLDIFAQEPIQYTTPVQLAPNVVEKADGGIVRNMREQLQYQSNCIELLFARGLHIGNPQDSIMTTDHRHQACVTKHSVVGFWGILFRSDE